MKTNGKITKELKELGTKINGKAPKGETISELINGIASDYEGGTGGTTVVANPTLAGTEDDLSGLQVGETKYKVPNVQLYEHNINYHCIDMIHNNVQECCFSVTTDSPTPFTFSTIIAYLNSVLPVNQLDDETMPYAYKGIKATGYMTFSEDSMIYFAKKIIKWTEQGGGAGHEGISCTVANGKTIEGQFVPMSTMFTLEETYTIEEQTFNTIEDVVIPVPNTSNNLG